MERLSPLKILGALLAVAGVIVLSGGGAAAGSSHLAGAIVVFSAATLAGFGSVLYKRGPRQSVGGHRGRARGRTADLPAREPAAWRALDPPTDGGVVVRARLPDAGGLRRVRAVRLDAQPLAGERAAFVSVVVPIIAMLLGALVRHEPLGARSLAGAALAMVGLACGMAADWVAARARAPVAAAPERR